MIYDVSDIARKVEEKYITPSLGKNYRLAVILSCSPLPGEISYLKQIYRFCDKYGVTLRELRTCDPFHITQDLFGYPCDGVIRISDFGRDSNEYIDDRIGCEQDLDGTCIVNRSLWLEDDSHLRAFPCTALAAYLAIDEYFNHQLAGTEIAIINRSNVIGKPLALLLGSKRASATVHVMHSRSKITPSFLESMDAIVTATGKPEWFTLESANLVVDIGVAERDEKIVGDVDKKLEESALTHVVKSIGKSGIGQLTTTILFAKLFGGFKCAMWH